MRSVRRAARYCGAALVLVALGATAMPVAAAKEAPRPAGGWARSGIDVSYPQCGASLPRAVPFVIVGVNAGLANTQNPCLVEQLVWATGAVPQVPEAGLPPGVSLYLNTADPGSLYDGLPIADWPRSGTNPDGRCLSTQVATSYGIFEVGQSSLACAYQYGLNLAFQDLELFFIPAAAGAAVSDSPADYPWWLDVETTNSWQAGTSGRAMNSAVLEGMVAGLQAAGSGPIGVYSTASQWFAVTGGATSGGPLSALPVWIPGARKLSAAGSNCQLPAFTQGQVEMTQWAGPALDEDLWC